MSILKSSLFISWGESLAFFTPSTGKTFMLITLKAAAEAYRIFFKHFWWLFIANICLGLYVQILSGPQASQTLWLVFVATIFVWLLQIFLMCLATRPSINRKTYSYFTRYGWHFICFLLFSLIMLWVALCITVVQVLGLLGRVAITNIDIMIHLSSLIIIPLTFVGFWLYEGSALMPLYILPFFVFWTFFLLDSPMGWRAIRNSLKNAIKMVLYNYPFCLISFGGLLGIYKLLYRCVEYISIFIYKLYLMHLGADLGEVPAMRWKIAVNIFVPLVMVLLAPLFISFLSNFYIKRVHEQFLLYFPKKIQYKE